MKICTPITLAILSLLTTASAAHATGYYLVVYNRASTGPATTLGYAGFSTSLVNSYRTNTLGTDIAFGGLADFNGDSIPEVVTASNRSPEVNVWNFITGAPLTNFDLPGAPASTGGPITITAPTITVLGSTTGTFTYSPAATPTPANPFLDLDGDGIADSISYNPGTEQITLTNGATNATTSFFPAFAAAPQSVSIFTWTPTPTPEPASLSLLTLAAPLLLKRRR